MQKTTTLTKKTDSLVQKNKIQSEFVLEPKLSTLQNILSYAASYRAEKVGQGQFVEIILN